MTKAKKTKEVVESKPIYIEFPISEGETTEVNLEDWQAQSEKSLDQLVTSLQEVARRVVSGLDELTEETCPSEMSLSFGIDSHPEAGAVIAFNPKKATYWARLVWYQKEKPVVSIRSTPGLIPPAQGVNKEAEETDDAEDED